MGIPPHLNYTLFSRDKCFNFSKNKGVINHRRGIGLMSNLDPNKPFSFEFDEQGTNEVSEQIMNSYNSGYVGQNFEVTNKEEAAQITAE
jgi:hypothetical protein